MAEVQQAERPIRETVFVLGERLEGTSTAALEACLERAWDRVKRVFRRDLSCCAMALALETHLSFEVYQGSEARYFVAAAAVDGRSLQVVWRGEEEASEARDPGELEQGEAGQACGSVWTAVCWIWTSLATWMARTKEQRRG